MLMAEQARARLLELFRDRAISLGRFTLASGKESTYYINSKKVLFNGEAIWLVGEILWQLTKDLNIQAIGGVNHQDAEFRIPAAALIGASIGVLYGVFKTSAVKEVIVFRPAPVTANRV